jgi:TM2 domain-containing membrane protein YozV
LSQVCPYCRTEIAAGDTTLVVCEACSTPHHGDCWLENGGCTLFGCTLAPPDEPKVQVTATDMVHAPGTQAATFGVAATNTGFGDAAAVRLVPVPPTSQAPPPPPPPPASISGATAATTATTTSPNVPSRVPGYVAPGSIFAATATASRSTKSRIAFVMLGIFLGSLGVHNFYAGYVWRGVLQLVITVATLGYAAVISWIWAIVEVCTVDRDAQNQVFL